MSTAVKQRREVETLAWITDDEAEFWTSSSPREKKPKVKHHPGLTNPSSDVVLTDGLFFKSNNSSNKEMEDPLSLMYKEKIEKDANEAAENAGKRQIFEFDQDTELNENIPGVNMSFLDRLLHQLTRSRPSEINYSSDEEFTEINQNEITAVNNNNVELSLRGEDNSKSDTLLSNSIRSFLKELNEETEVIRGKLDEETFLNRRSQKAKYSLP